MDKTVPAGATLLLDFIGGIEAPKGYDTIYGNNQDKLARTLTSKTVDAVIAAEPVWTKAYRSSAVGRYQFMNATLRAQGRAGLPGTQIFDANLQDRLAYHPLKRRGYEAFLAGTMEATEFGKRLTLEWASLPMLAATKGGARCGAWPILLRRKSLVKPEAVEAVLARVKAAKPVTPIPATDAHSTTETAKPGRAPAIISIAFVLVAAVAAFFLIRF